MPNDQTHDYTNSLFSPVVVTSVEGLKQQLERQLTDSEARSEQEKQSLAQELSRGKQAVINLMQVGAS